MMMSWHHSLVASQIKARRHSRIIKSMTCLVVVPIHLEAPLEEQEEARAPCSMKMISLRLLEVSLTQCIIIRFKQRAQGLEAHQYHWQLHKPRDIRSQHQKRVLIAGLILSSRPRPKQQRTNSWPLRSIQLSAALSAVQCISLKHPHRQRHSTFKALEARICSGRKTLPVESTVLACAQQHLWLRTATACSRATARRKRMKTQQIL